MRNYQTKSNQGALPDSITSTRFGAGEFNSVAVELEGAVTTSGQTLAPADGTGEVTDQLAMALAIYGAGGATYHVDTGAVNAYVLTPVSPKESPNAYFNGFSVVFEPGTVNTTASTVNVGGLGVKSVTLQNGTALSGGELSGTCCLKYNLSDDRFELIYSSDSALKISQYYEIDATQADQGATSTNPNTMTIYDVATLVGTSKFATIHLSHNPAAGNQTLYTFDTSLDLSTYPNLFFSIDPGAQFDRTTSDEVLTVHNETNFVSSDAQTITTVDMIRFERPGNLYPENWGATGDNSTDDLNAIQYAINAASNPGLTFSYGNVVFTGRYYISGPVTISAPIGAKSIGGATLDGLGSSTSAVIIESFNAYGYLNLPLIVSFTDCGLWLKGTSLSDIKLHAIQSVSVGIRIDTVNASYSTCLDNKIECHVISACTSACVEFKADNNANVVQGNEIYGNFMTNSLYGVYFNAAGLTPNWDSNKVQFQALDFVGVSNAKALYSNATDVPRFTFRIETWCGGITSSGAMFVDGVFNSLEGFMKIADSAAAGDWTRWNLLGVQSRIDFEDRNSGITTPIAAMGASNSRATWNSNTPVYTNIIQCSFQLTGDLTAGSTLTTYIYSPLASGYQTMTGKTTYQATNGVIIDYAVDTSATFSHEIAVVIRNVSGATITTGTTVYFALGIGI